MANKQLIEDLKRASSHYKTKAHELYESGEDDVQHATYSIFFEAIDQAISDLQDYYGGELPEYCYSREPSSNDIIKIKRNESGYYKLDQRVFAGVKTEKHIFPQKCNGCGKVFTIEYCPDGSYNYVDDMCDCEEGFSPSSSEVPSISQWLESQKKKRLGVTPEELNAALGVTKAQEEAMLAGSMFGWHVPGANPKNYDKNGNFSLQQPGKAPQQAYAMVGWEIEDVLELRPDWTDEQADKWLFENEEDLREHVVAAGNEWLEDNLPEEADDAKTYKYKDIIFEDFNEDADHVWANICEHCVAKYNVSKSLLDEAGSADPNDEDATLCSVKDCQNVSDYYIDFPDK